MALRSAAAAAQNGGGICKRIVRKIGDDILPLEALYSLKPSKPPANKGLAAAGDSGGEMTKSANRSMFPGRHVQFRRNNNGPNRPWKPNLKLKRMFTYIHGAEIQPKVTIHTVKSVERMGGISKSTVMTPYYKSETQMGLMWKGKIESKWVEFWNKEAGYFSPEEEAKIAKVLQVIKQP
ncbi:uncharacterized protein A4U43_C09F1300 [Asparagus officinalis]|uniref:Uncharacterized protein n=1 Tax=Asparagus officinalis TaxID=4686 RepID=A0A5P1E987_ASPOF|nr:uncharacterized protein LOC109824622 [Asparagus officinalis]ONK57516.1 uncharacterized protein A4U43_C09F1300 [Asparagus officinalis]